MIKSDSKNELVKLISICGQVAEHKSEMMRLHDKDENMILSVLNDDEQETLKILLEKLQKSWLKDHNEHHKKNKQ